jgi:hypothetical protein
MKFRYARDGGKWARFEAPAIDTALTHCARKWPTENAYMHLQVRDETEIYSGAKPRWRWVHHVHHT